MVHETTDKRKSNTKLFLELARHGLGANKKLEFLPANKKVEFLGLGKKKDPCKSRGIYLTGLSCLSG
jgi:hypothetical protein